MSFEDIGVVAAEGGVGPEGFGQGAEFFGFVGGAWASMAAGAVAIFGDEGRRKMFVRPWGVFLVVGDVLAGAGDGVGVDAAGEGGGVSGSFGNFRIYFGKCRI